LQICSKRQKNYLKSLRKKLHNRKHSCTKKFDNIFKELKNKLTVLLEFVNAASLSNRIKLDKLRQFYEDFSNHQDKDVKKCIGIAKKYINSSTKQKTQTKNYRQKVKVQYNSNSKDPINKNSHIANHDTNLTQTIPPHFSKKYKNINNINNIKSVKENNSDFLVTESVFN